MLSTPAIPPPLTASSSRSTRVINQLNETWEAIQKEVSAARTQLEAMQAAKLQNELDSQSYAESNTLYRASIQELMQILESKQQVLDVTKESSQDLEGEVKRLKDEAMASRKKLDDLRKKEKVLKEERDRAVAAKEQVQRQYDVLRESLVGLDSKCERQLAELQHNLQSVTRQMKQMMTATEEAAEWLEAQVQEEMSERQNTMHELKMAQTRAREAENTHLKQVQEELKLLLEQLNLHTHCTNDWKSEVNQCRDHVSGLVHRIREYSTEELA
ncbi:hypothetical protein BDF14DRAFT_1743196 [Spinellus fusiger]|nr:hypothetical protein BDF14DRAFT_1743196 [Spinellus fusiger]